MNREPIPISAADAAIIVAEIDIVAVSIKNIYDVLPYQTQARLLAIGHSLAKLREKLAPKPRLKLKRKRKKK